MDWLLFVVAGLLFGLIYAIFVVKILYDRVRELRQAIYGFTVGGKGSNIQSLLDWKSSPYSMQSRSNLVQLGKDSTEYVYLWVQGCNERIHLAPGEQLTMELYYYPDDPMSAPELLHFHVTKGRIV